jgi:hypothetical protein
LVNNIVYKVSDALALASSQLLIQPRENPSRIAFENGIALRAADGSGLSRADEGHRTQSLLSLS